MNNFITTALPYANGNLHYGHFFEAVIADIYAKHRRVPLISGDDQHGAAITLFADQHSLDIKKHLGQQYVAHVSQYKSLSVDFAHFGSTHTDLHRKVVLYVYEKLKQKGFILQKQTISWYDVEKNQFLPDRYIKGICPYCGATNVSPHICESCNRYFESKQLIEPVSELSNSTPILKESAHIFLNTTQFYEHLEYFCNQLNINTTVRKKILEHSLSTLNELDISRDLPYYGIQIPQHDLAFYVWFDAPIGYLTFILETLSESNPDLSFDELLDKLKSVNIEHVIGKDIVYFHTFIWLNLLKILELPLPKKIHVHGWITQDNGDKLSKSNGNHADLTSLSESQLDAIRFYFASLYDGTIQDNSFSLKLAFEQYNQFIVGKYVNIYSRISKLLSNRQITTLELSKSAYTFDDTITKYLDDFHLRNVVLELFKWIDTVNTYIQNAQPWKIEDTTEFERTCFFALNEFRHISKFIGLICPYLNTSLEQIDYANIRHIRLADRISF